MSEYNFLKPKVGAPKKLRDPRNGQFVNPPLYMQLGGFKTSSDINRGTTANVRMERGGPRAKQGQPI